MYHLFHPFFHCQRGEEEFERREKKTNRLLNKNSRRPKESAVTRFTRQKDQKTVIRFARRKRLLE